MALALAVVTLLALLPRTPGAAVLPTTSPDADPTSSPTPTPTLLQADLGGQTVVADVPAGSPVGVAILFPDAGQSTDQVMAGPLAVALRDAGWATATGQLAGDSWGSPASTTAAQDLAGWVEETTGLAPYLFVSTGMGATTSIAAIARSGLAPPCWYGSASVVDVSAAAADPLVEQQILAAWGSVPPADAAPLILVAGLPQSMQFALARGASAVGGRDDTDVLAAALQNSGHTVSVSADAADLVAFANGCAQ